MVFFIGELSVRIGPCDMVFSIIGDFGMVFSIVGLSVTDSPSWTPPLWMIFALAGSSGMAFSIEVRPTQTPAGNVCLFWFVARSLMSSKDDRPAMSVALSPSSFFASQRVSVMYVCFGFSLARLRRARTIDLQCQSLSLRRAFLLRSVCLSLHLTVESFAVRWPTRSQNRSKITVKIDRKSIPGDTSGHPKSTKNRSRDPLRTPRGV